MLYLKRKYDFSLAGALFFSGLMSVANITGTSAEAAQMDRIQIEREFPDTMFTDANPIMETTTIFSGDGRVVATGPLGQFEGEWWTFRDELCVAFDFGPRKGVTCDEVERTGTTSFRVGGHAELIRVASARLIEY